MKTPEQWAKELGCKMTYEFKNIDEFVSFLDTKAKELREKAKRAHPRSHDNARFGQGAAELESIAAIVRSSNLVACTDYMRAALSQAVA